MQVTIYIFSPSFKAVNFIPLHTSITKILFLWYYSGFTTNTLQRLSVDELKCVLQLLVDKGKCQSTLHTPKESVKAYDAALLVSWNS